MASSINASTSGAGGVITTADNSGILNLQSNGTTVATVGPTGFSTPANQTINVGNTFGFKNRLINGNMVIDQRNAGASTTPVDLTYTLDRWYVRQTTSGKFSVQQNAGSVTPPAGFTNYLGCTVVSAYSVGSTDLFAIEQRIEGFNIGDLGWGTANAKTITLSFWVRSSLTGTFGGNLRNSASAYNYAFSYSIPTANTWTQISVTIPGPTAGTWETGNGIGVIVEFALGVGSSYVGAPNAWTSSYVFGPTGGTSVVATNGATWYVTGAQFEVGSQTTSFDFRSYTNELQLCQRYYEKSYDQGTKPGTATTASALGTFPAAYAVYFPAIFKVTKRVSPTVTGYSTFDGSVNNYSVNNTSNVGLSGSIGTGTGGTTFYTGSTPGNVSAYVQFTADSEI